MSNKVVVSTPTSGPATAVVTEAKILDIASTLMSSDSFVTGTYGLVQKLALVAIGMSVQSKRKLGTFNPI